MRYGIYERVKVECRQVGIFCFDEYHIGYMVPGQVDLKPRYKQCLFYLCVKLCSQIMVENPEPKNRKFCFIFNYFYNFSFKNTSSLWVDN